MLLVGNGKVITQDSAMPFLENGCVAIKDTTILEVGKTEDINKKYPNAEFIDAKGNIIMPGMINTHMHIYSAFARGMKLKGDAPKNFIEILEKLWWKLDKTLTLEDVKYSALTTYMECIKNGTTTIFDHHASQGAVKDSLFTIGEAARKLNVRSCLCYEVSDRDGKEVTQEAICENIDFMKHTNSLKDDMLRGMFGLHASFTLSNKTLLKCTEAISGLKSGFHIHTAEAIDDVYDSLNKYGKTVIKRLMDFGILGEKTIAVHCVHASDEELNILKDTKTNVIHNPESNMGNAVGCSPAIRIMEKGITQGLGTDGYTSDMFESMKVANILHKHNLCNPSAAWGEIPKMIFDNNKKIASKHFGKSLGCIKKDAYADLIIVRYNSPTPINSSNYNSHILFGMMGRSVDTTIINGKVMMRHGRILGIDEEEIYVKSREVSSKLWSRI